MVGCPNFNKYATLWLSELEVASTTILGYSIQNESIFKYNIAESDIIIYFHKSLIWHYRYDIIAIYRDNTKISEVSSTERSRSRTPNNLKKLKNIPAKPGFILEGKRKKVLHLNYTTQIEDRKWQICSAIKIWGLKWIRYEHMPITLPKANLLPKWKAGCKSWSRFSVTSTTPWE